MWKPYTVTPLLVIFSVFTSVAGLDAPLWIEEKLWSLGLIKPFQNWLDRLKKKHCCQGKNKAAFLNPLNFAQVVVFFLPKSIDKLIRHLPPSCTLHCCDYTSASTLEQLFNSEFTVSFQCLCLIYYFPLVHCHQLTNAPLQKRTDIEEIYQFLF